ncbi:MULTISPECIES: hypothetical protein [Paenibacillus]|uniref:hypothetical protein n=1 Tax=Paenibacillus TaxID=44249 RepID=UPI001BD0A863|nr:hypothetical protein [Paenibacillus dendritiformis]
MLTLSTAHITEEISGMLSDDALPLIVYPKDEYGFFMLVPEEGPGQRKRYPYPAAREKSHTWRAGSCRPFFDQKNEDMERTGCIGSLIEQFWASFLFRNMITWFSSTPGVLQLKFRMDTWFSPTLDYTLQKDTRLQPAFD